MKLSLKDQIVAECDVKIAEKQAQLDLLRVEHEGFKAEDDLYDAYYEKYCIVSKQMDALVEEKWLFNWDNRDTWARGNKNLRAYKLMEQGYSWEDVKLAFNKVSSDKEEKIRESTVYVTLEADRKLLCDLQHGSISKRHNEIHRLMEDLSHSISWWMSRSHRARTDKGFLIQWGKDSKIREAKEAKIKEQETNVLEIIKILEDDERGCL